MVLKSKTAAALVLATGLALAPVAAFAHHSFAMFDQGKVMTVKGTMKEFQWTNPHAVIWFYADPPVGGAPAPDLWSIELTSPGNLSRAGWSRQILKPGDKVSIDINPLRDGQHGGILKQLTIVDTGKVLTFGFTK